MLIGSNFVVRFILNHIQSSRKYLRGLPALATAAVASLLLAACSDSNSGSGTTPQEENNSSTDNEVPPKLPLILLTPTPPKVELS